MSAYLRNYVSDVKTGVDESEETQAGDEFYAKTAPTNATDKYRVSASTSLRYSIGKGKQVQTFEIPMFDMNTATRFLDGNFILYGVSRTGKTVCMLDIMFRLKDYFPKVFVFAPTNAQNHDYDGIIPPAALFDKVTLDNIADIYKFQEAAMNIYGLANSLGVLNSIFSRVADEPANLYLSKIMYAREESMLAIDRDIQDGAARKSERERIKKLFKNKLRVFFKGVIRHAQYKLDKSKLNEQELFAVKYLNFNPRVLVIFDDAMTEVAEIIKQGTREKNEVVSNFFFKGRHKRITHGYTLQSDKRMDAELRKNCFYSIFTSSSEAIAFFGRGANGFTPDERKHAAAAVAAIFNTDGKDKHQKLIYLKDEKDKFQYLRADRHDVFEMGSALFRKYCKCVARKGHSFDRENKFMTVMSKYADGGAGKQTQ